ncbi:hypothetical protein D4S03_07730 [bacterium]|nr:MAG: hypothetical protein D4S03_07730 [bacterium]
MLRVILLASPPAHLILILPHRQLPGIFLQHLLTSMVGITILLELRQLLIPAVQTLLVLLHIHLVKEPLNLIQRQ